MRKLLLLSVMLATPMLADPAFAQVQFGFGGDDPIDIAAERATYQGGLTVLEENVVVKQDDTTVMADRMDIYRDEAGAPTIAGSIKLGSLKRIEAHGNFSFENPENTVTGDKGVYYADREIFIVSGNVQLTQPGGSSVNGKRLVYNLKSRSARFGSACETGTAQAGECERVTFELK